MKALEQARAKVNTLEFGTAEWDAAMQEVRALVAAQNAETDFGKQTSIDGDVWSV